MGGITGKWREIGEEWGETKAGVEMGGRVRSVGRRASLWGAVGLSGALWGSAVRWSPLAPPPPEKAKRFLLDFCRPGANGKEFPYREQLVGTPRPPAFPLYPPPPHYPSPPAPHPPRPPLLFLLPRSLPRVSGLPVAPQRFAAPRLFPRPPRPCWLTGSCVPSGFPYRTWRRRTRRWRRRWWKTCGATSSCSAAPCRSCCPASSADRWGSSTGTPFTSTPHHQPTPSPPIFTPLPAYKVL